MRKINIGGELNDISLAGFHFPLVTDDQASEILSPDNNQKTDKPRNACCNNQ